MSSIDCNVTLYLKRVYTIVCYKPIIWTNGVKNADISYKHLGAELSLNHEFASDMNLSNHEYCNDFTFLFIWPLSFLMAVSLSFLVLSLKLIIVFNSVFD